MLTLDVFSGNTKLSLKMRFNKYVILNIVFSNNLSMLILNFIFLLFNKKKNYLKKNFVNLRSDFMQFVVIFIGITLEAFVIPMNTLPPEPTVSF